ncbi:MAG TPA: hypothetical protein VIB99_02570 [Candidatus Limnocylindrales bacterium]|jgi:hypothetical protein
MNDGDDPRDLDPAPVADEPAAIVQPELAGEPATELEPTEDPEPAAEPELAEPALPPPPLPAPKDRPVELRLASIHLRTGVLALARAELETSAGRGELDDTALLDLAEVRWRTDDVTGAGEAAAAYFATGREDTLALVIATEATASIGRSTEARRLAARALARGDVNLDSIFRGIRPSSYWPATSAMSGVPAGTLFPTPRPGSLTGTAGVTGAAVLGRLAAEETEKRASPPGTPPGPRHDPSPSPQAPQLAGAIGTSATLWSDAETLAPGSAVHAGGGPELPEPAAELNAAKADLGGGRPAAAAIRLAVILRVAPELAPAVLDVLAGAGGPSIELVRGDALRLAGREAEARRAYAAAAAQINPPPPA